MLRGLLSRIFIYLRLYRHRKKWRKNNSHNRLIASTFFPIGKVKGGNHSYGDLHVISYGEENEGLSIGHYVSIANDVWFLLGGNHYYKRFANYPFQVKFVDINFVETWSKGRIIIGDDVWIGTGAFILPGVQIGQGAIVAAKAVVATDVPPYAIVAGNPAQVVKFRFKEDIINKLVKIDFSRLEPEWVLKHLDVYRNEQNPELILNITGIIEKQMR